MIIYFQANADLSPLWRPAARGAWRNPSSREICSIGGCEGESRGDMRDSPVPGQSALGRQWFWLHLFPQKGGRKKMVAFHCHFLAHAAVGRGRDLSLLRGPPRAENRANRGNNNIDP